MAAALKDEGNKLFAAKKFDEAMYVSMFWSRRINIANTQLREKFSQAIELDPSNHVLYSNRSGAYASLRSYELALQDAKKTTELKPDWAKGWGRQGAALHGTGDLRT